MLSAEQFLQFFVAVQLGLMFDFGVPLMWTDAGYFVHFPLFLKQYSRGVVDFDMSVLMKKVCN